MPSRWAGQTLTPFPHATEFLFERLARLQCHPLRVQRGFEPCLQPPDHFGMIERCLPIALLVRQEMREMTWPDGYTAMAPSRTALEMSSGPVTTVAVTGC